MSDSDSVVATLCVAALLRSLSWISGTLRRGATFLIEPSVLLLGGLSMSFLCTCVFFSKQAMFFSLICFVRGCLFYFVSFDRVL